jgi:hypothetical protein
MTGTIAGPSSSCHIDWAGEDLAALRIDLGLGDCKRAAWAAPA